MLYRRRSEHATEVEQFVRDIAKSHSLQKVDLVDVDTRDGISTASLYGVMQYPAVLTLANDGQLIKDWQGKPLPLMDEVAYYARQ
jgi:hypothetical protein